MAGRAVGRGAVPGLGVVLSLGLGALWWWAVVRLAVTPEAGVLEGTVAAGGWGLSLLPVHCVARARAAGVVAQGRWRAVWRAPARSRERGRLLEPGGPVERQGERGGVGGPGGTGGGGAGAGVGDGEARGRGTSTENGVE
ncbi:hypothetical protein ABT273_00070 [Streptomyces humidus]